MLVSMRIFPLMLFVVVNSMANWVAIASFLGRWVFLALPVTFTTVYSLVRTFTNSQSLPESEEFLPLKTSIFALWLPSIIGHHPYSFLVSAITTLVTKVLLLLMGLFYALSGLHQHINPHPTLLWCEDLDKWEEENIGNLTLCTFQGNYTTNITDKCFNSGEEGVQKLRICDPEDEFTFRIIITIAFIVSNFLSFVASMWLNKISDYLQLYQATKTFLWIFTSKPVIHRSALHQLVTSDKEEDLDLLEEMLQVNDIGDVVNRPNREGQTALELAFETNSPSTLMLWAAGAKPSKDQRFKEALMDQAGLHHLGHQHVIECPELASADLNAKRMVEQKIENLFQVGVKMVFVPTFGLNEEKKKELRKFSREWNKDHNVKGEGCSKLMLMVLDQTNFFLKNDLS